ncbi:MAG: winged helix-turn-helix domain-containing protein [Candidatus Nanohaloarchaea archaeon]
MAVDWDKLDSRLEEIEGEYPWERTHPHRQIVEAFESYEHSPMSVKEISENSDITVGTVARRTEELSEKGVIEEDGEIGGAQTYSLSSEYLK